MQTSPPEPSAWAALLDWKPLAVLGLVLLALLSRRVRKAVVALIDRWSKPGAS